MLSLIFHNSENKAYQEDYTWTCPGFGIYIVGLSMFSLDNPEILIYYLKVMADWLLCSVVGGSLVVFFNKDEC